MTDPVLNKEAGWQEWLKRYGLWDQTMGEEAAYLRYRKLSKVKFDVVPVEDWGPFLRDLVALEPALVFGEAIGYAGDYPFQLTVTDSTPIRQKPIIYPKVEREWIRTYVKKMEDLGLIRRVLSGVDPDPLCISSVVLVKDGQSQQEYRFCGNFVELNARTQLPPHPMIDCTTVLDDTADWDLMSAIDIKAAFNNVPIALQSQQYCGIVTQDGVYVYEKMTFGFSAAPCHFQFVMCDALNKAHPTVPTPSHATYLDDCTVGATATGEGPALVLQTWRETLAALWRLACRGLPINIQKCRFLCRRLPLLGIVLHEKKYQLGRKALKRLIAAELPSTLHQLQAVIGRLNYASQFIPDFRRRMKPLLNLMKKDGGDWLEEHTNTLNEVAELVYQRIKLGLVDITAPARIHVDADTTDGSAVMTQGEGPDYVINAMIGRPLQPTEAACTLLERQLLIAAWAVKRLARYTLWLPRVIIVLPHAAEVACLQLSGLPLRLQTRLVELSQYGCHYQTGEGAWAVQGEVARLQFLPPEEEEPIAERFWDHKDQLIRRPKTPKIPQRILETAIVLYFDGGCRKKTGSGGYLVFWKSTCLGGKARFYGADAPTNNVAEGLSMLHALQWVRTHFQDETEEAKHIVLKGDSQLIISFLQRKARPAKRELVLAIREAEDIIRKWKGIKVSFQHVPREDNAWADWLARMALDMGKNADLYELTNIVPQPHEPPPTDLHPTCSKPAAVANPEFQAPDSVRTAAPNDQQLMVRDIAQTAAPAHSHTPALEADLEQCEGCQQRAEVTQLSQCHSCGGWWHSTCLPPEFKPKHHGPWHCNTCLAFHGAAGTADITLDAPLMQYLADGQLPRDPVLRSRICEAADFARLDEKGRIWLQPAGDVAPRLVPPIHMREQLVKDTLQQLGFPNGQQLYEALRATLFWPGMRQDCIAISQRAYPRQLESARFLHPPYLLPTEKGSRPFSVWCIDTIVNLKPSTPNNCKDIIVAIDGFTKWIEVGILPTLDSHATAEWFHANIVCRYGVPSIVRSDRGREYQGEFDAYLTRLGVSHRLIATMNPRANGQIERYNRTLEAGLRKFSAMAPDGQWWKYLPDVVRGLRLLPVRATGFSPYVLVFKQQPQLPIPMALRAMTDDDIIEWGSHQVEELLGIWEEILVEVRHRQADYDASMVRQYLKRRNLDKVDVRFIFSPGDQVLIRAKHRGKLAVRAHGPYRFVRYLGPSRVTAEIEASGGQTKIVSATHLRPMLPERAPRMYRYPVQKQPPSILHQAVQAPPPTRPASWASSVSSGVDTSDLESVAQVSVSAKRRRQDKNEIGYAMETSMQAFLRHGAWAHRRERM